MGVALGNNVVYISCTNGFGLAPRSVRQNRLVPVRSKEDTFELVAQPVEHI